MNKRAKLIKLLRDGHFHSGKQLSIALGVSRTSVWKYINTYQDFGINIHAVRGRGYRLVDSIELLEKEKILSATTPEVRALISRFELFDEVDSTNQYVMQYAIKDASSGLICLAERQLSGRGQWGNEWYSPYGRNIYLSLMWRYSFGPSMLTGMSIIAAAAIAQALRKLGVNGIGLKWPNDILWNNKKLAGVLIEVVGQSSGPCSVIVGIGLNINMHGLEDIDISQPWTDVETALGKNISRNTVCASLIQSLIQAMYDYEKNDCSGMLEEWRRYDFFSGRQVMVRLANETLHGIAQGVDESGALLLKTHGAVRRLVTGRISLRESEGT